MEQKHILLFFKLTRNKTKKKQFIKREEKLGSFMFKSTQLRAYGKKCFKAENYLFVPFVTLEKSIWKRKTGIAHTDLVEKASFLLENRENKSRKLLRHFSYKLYLHSDTHRIHIYIYIYLTHLHLKFLHFANYTLWSFVIAIIFAKDILTNLITATITYRLHNR